VEISIHEGNRLLDHEDQDETPAVRGVVEAFCMACRLPVASNTASKPAPSGSPESSGLASTGTLSTPAISRALSER
jgi:hypothetical protein